MANISILSRLVQGAQRNVDLSTNTLVVNAVKVGGNAGTDLTKTILDKLILINAAADADGTFDTRYTKISDLASVANSKGASLVSIEDPDGYYTGTTVESALQQIGSVIGSGAAADISYDNATSGLTATNVQDAIDETVVLAENAQSTADAAIPATEKGANNGVATLDGGGKIPVSQLPSSVMTYEGTWNAATNTPTLADGSGDAGQVYLTTVAGTVDFGSGPITFAIGDWAVYSGSIWQKSSNSNAVVSVNGQTGVVALTTTDIPEGTNLYYTATQARADVIASSITNGDTTHAPSGDAVFDALALKQDASAELTEAVAFFAATDISGAEAEQLTNGSNADSLHTHASLIDVKTVGEAFGASTIWAPRYAVAADAGFVAGRIYKATNDASSVDNFYAIGLMPPVGALTTGDPARIVKSGLMTATGHGFTAGLPLYLGAAGVVTQTAPSAANSAVVRVGIVVDANTIDVQVAVVGVN